MIDVRGWGVSSLLWAVPPLQLVLGSLRQQAYEQPSSTASAGLPALLDFLRPWLPAGRVNQMNPVPSTLLLVMIFTTVIENKPNTYTKPRLPPNPDLIQGREKVDSF